MPTNCSRRFVEIIENAMDALEEAGGGSLEDHAQRQGNEAVLQFSDTGPGIREPQRVFDPFYTTKPVGKGTGLGLSAVYGVIQDHDGQITCQNQPEGGALFVVRLPAATRRQSGRRRLAGAAGDLTSPSWRSLRDLQCAVSRIVCRLIRLSRGRELAIS